MTKRSYAAGTKIPLADINAWMYDLKDEPLYSDVVDKAADYVITDTDNVATVVADGTSATVEITLPAATGTGRIIQVIGKEVTNAVTLVPAGSDVIDAAGVVYTFTPAWEIATVQDIGAGQWATLFATAALT